LTRSRYAFSQGRKTMRHYSKMPDFAKPIRSSPVPRLGAHAGH
jgi:hypothetical protein